MINLDYIAAKYAGKVNVSVEGIENTATSALNILHEQGIYALSVWLLEKKEQNGKANILDGLDSLLLDAQVPFHLIPGQKFSNPDNVREALTQDLKIMFFAKDLIELYLIYVRHLAKANPDRKKNNGAFEQTGR